MTTEVANEGESVEPAIRETPSSELCSICCGPLHVVAVGRCNHALTCAICTLRLRLCYRDHACPFCKTQLKKVYLTEKPTTPESQLSYQDLATNRAQFTTDKHWSGGIWVDRESHYEGRSLLEYLRAQMRRSCRLCDTEATQRTEFECFKDMREHFRRMHEGSTLCNVCYQANRYFPRELDIFEDDASFQSHLESHPKCEYCGHHFFGKDELHSHMRKKHCLCQLCHVQGERHVYFENTRHYSQHLREKHFACTQPDCVDCLIAFNTAEELEQHLSEVHGIRPGRRPGTRTFNSFSMGAAPRLTGPVPPRRGFAGNDLQRRGEEGLMMIDDDLPPVYGVQPRTMAHSAYQPVHRAPVLQEEFPALPTAAPAPQPIIQVPKKVVVRRVCPCGRQSRGVLVPEGTSVAPLACDVECERAQRRAQLADAFNIDTSTYGGAFEGQFSVDLITWARNDPHLVQQLENQLQDRIRSRATQRFTLDNLPRDSKKLAMGLVESYGAVGRLVRTANAVDVVLTDKSCLPGRKLTQFATSLSEDAYQELLRESLENTLILEDIAKAVNLRRYLASWDGDYEMEFLTKNVARLKFRTPQAFKAARDGLGGGIRDAFRVRVPLAELNKTPSDSSQPSITKPHEPSPGLRLQRLGTQVTSKEERNEQLELGNSFEVLSRL